MRPVRVEIPASGNSVAVPLDIYQVGPATLGISGVSGTVDVTLQYTMDDVWNPDVTPAWVDWVTGESTNGAHPLVDAGGAKINATAVRAVNEADGTAELVVTQPGTRM